MTKDILAKALLFDFQDKSAAIQKKGQAADSMLELANMHLEMAELCEMFHIEMEKLESVYGKVE